MAADIVFLITASTAWSIQNEARYEFLDGPGILPMDHDKKPVKSESGQIKEAKSIESADEVRPRLSYFYHTSLFPSCHHHPLLLNQHQNIDQNTATHL